MKKKILLVDDDIALAKTLDTVLQNNGYQTLLAHTAEDGLRIALSEHPDLVVLDVMIPVMGGWEVCRRLREHSEVPIIFLTALDNSENIVRGLEMGADDYVVKPFDPPVILARIRAQMRRTTVAEPSPNTPLTFGEDDLVIDFMARRVMVDGQEVSLTPREFELLTVLATNPGRVLTTKDLVSQAWNLDDDTAADNIKPYIHYIRKKIEKDPTSPRWLVTVRGIGYRFSME